MKIVKRWVKIILGGIVTVIGIILMPVPGPGGTPVTLAGLAILSSELPWAKRIMEYFKEQVVWARSGKQNFWVRIGVVGGIACFYVVTSIVMVRFLSGN